MADAVIAIAGLQKRYGSVEALRGLDLQVTQGSICGFLGRNGAGKTTTLKTLLGMTRADGGSATVCGLDALAPANGVAIRQRTAFVSDDKDLLNDMTVAQIIRFTAGFFPGWRRDLEDQYIRRFELPAQQRVGKLSRGTRTKLAVLLALARGAALLILDEPTLGLDPAATEEVLQAVVSQVAQEGATVFFSSHQLAEVEQIADAIAIVDHGRVVISGLLDDVRAGFQRVTMVFPGDAPDHRFSAAPVTRAVRQGRSLALLVSGDVDALRAEALSLGAVAVESTPVSLKDVFLESTAMEAL